MKTISICILFFLSFTPIFSQVKKGKSPVNYEEKLSYSVGFDVTRSLRKMDVKLDKKWMIQGIIDALVDSSGSPLLTNDEMELIFQELQRRNQNKLDKEAKNIAAPNRIAGDEYLLKEMSADPEIIKTQTGLAYKIIKKGSIKKPGPADQVTVKYTGSLIDGTIFDQTGNQTATFDLNGVIPGWTEGLQLIGEGGIIKLIIPAELAYGDNPPGGTPIQPGSTLLFNVELVKVGK